MVDARASKRGFTLIELMVTMAVLGILIVVAVPNYKMIVMNSRMVSQANDVMASLNLARSEAVKRAANVTVCASSNGTSCTGGWADGWIVKDASSVIQVKQALDGGSSLSGGTDVASTLTFTGTGRTTIATTATPTSTTLTLCPPSPASVKGRAIQLERTGRARVSQVTCP